MALKASLKFMCCVARGKSGSSKFLSCFHWFTTQAMQILSKDFFFLINSKRKVYYKG